MTRDPIDDELERLRRATESIAGSVDFGARIAAAAAALPRPSRLTQLARAWWTVPIAAALAAGAVLWAVHVRSDRDRAEASSDVEAALSFPTGAATW